MNINTYLQEYNSIICYRQNNPLPSNVYTEKHHIIPKSCGGSNASWNLVKLLPEEHFTCHKLLVSIYPVGSKQHNAMARAWMRMSNCGKYAVSAEDYGDARRKFSESRKGTHLTLEQRKKISDRWKGVPKPPRSAEYRKHIGESHKGFRHSIVSRLKMSNSHKGRVDSRLGKLHSVESKQIMSERRSSWWERRKQSDEKITSAMANKRWIKNEITHETKIIDKTDDIPLGWVLGRFNAKNQGKCWYNDGVSQVFQQVCPPGYVRGMLKRT